MATVEIRTTQAGRKVYRAKVRIKGCRTESATFNRLTDARRWAQSTEVAILERRRFPTSLGKRHTLAHAIDRYVAETLSPTSSNTRNVQRHLVWWRAVLGGVSLAELTSERIGRARDQLRVEKKRNGQPKSAATIVRYMASLSPVLSIAAKEWGWLSHSPMRNVRRPPEPQGRVRFLGDDERARLISACRTSENNALHPIVVLAISTGMRLGEIMGLRWNQVDLGRGRITLYQTKNGESRGMPLVGSAHPLLRTRFESRRTDTELVFPRTDGKKPVQIAKTWATALRRADIHDFRFHDLRHCTASYLAMQGASSSEIAAVLGHKTLQMVKRYAHLSDDHTQALVTRMNTQIFGEVCRMRPSRIDRKGVNRPTRKKALAKISTLTPALHARDQPSVGAVGTSNFA